MFLTYQEQTIELSEEQVKKYIPENFWNAPLFLLSITPEIFGLFQS